MPSPYRVVNPTTGKLEREVPAATNEEIEDALQKAHKGFLKWRTTSLEHRAEALHRVADLYEEQAQDLATIIAREMGKPIREGVGEVELVASIYRYYADQATTLLADVPLSPTAGGVARVRKEPIGAILGIMPWNYPYYQVARLAAPNHMVGNAIVLKHAPQCPESALAIAAIFDRAGLGAVFANVFATNEQVETMIADDRIVGVSLTGSERAGAVVAATAGKHLKKVVLEMGGSDPFIVLDSADVDAAVSAAVAARMGNAGQACNAAKRFIVRAEIFDRFVDDYVAQVSAMVAGDPVDENTDYGPLSSGAARNRLMEQVNDAVAKGAAVRAGGAFIGGPGAFVEATVLTDVVPGMRAFEEELFGPVAVIYRVNNDEEAIALANASAYGLGGAVFGEDIDRTAHVANSLETGMVWINSAQGSMADLPFGGVKRSGFGRELGPEGIEAFVNKKLIYTPARPAT